MVAQGKTEVEIAKYIDADEVIFQDLDDLKAACMEAADPASQVEDFEVGVFCGKYITDVPEDYLSHLSNLRNSKKAQKNSILNVMPGGVEGTVISSSGPADGPPKEYGEVDYFPGDANIGIKVPDYAEDIRYVRYYQRNSTLFTYAGSLYNIANEYPVHEK